MEVMCDDNEMYDSSPSSEDCPPLPLEVMHELSKMTYQMREFLTSNTALAERFDQFFKEINGLYEWHVAQNHFPDTRGQHHYGGRDTLYAAYPSMSYEVPVASSPSFDWNAFGLVCDHSWKMWYSIFEFYFNPSNFYDTDYDAGRAILMDMHPPYTMMPEPMRTEVQVENQPRPFSYQDYLDTSFEFNTYFTAVYERRKLEIRMIKEMYEWHLSQNHFPEMCHVVLSKL